MLCLPDILTSSDVVYTFSAVPLSCYHFYAIYISDHCDVMYEDMMVFPLHQHSLAPGCHDCSQTWSMCDFCGAEYLQ